MRVRSTLVAGLLVLTSASAAAAQDFSGPIHSDNYVGGSVYELPGDGSEVFLGALTWTRPAGMVVTHGEFAIWLEQFTGAGVDFFLDGVLAVAGAQTGESIFVGFDPALLDDDVLRVTARANGAGGSMTVGWGNFEVGGVAGEVPTEVVPEPITMVLLGSGLVGVGGVARRRKQKDVA